MTIDLTLIIVALITAVSPTLAVILAWRSNKRAIEEVHLTINSRMSELLSSSKAASKAEGREIGRKEK